MRFIDANVFLYAFLKPKRELSQADINIKRSARKIIRLIDTEEKVLTTTAHISEVLNILEAHTNYDYAREAAERLILNDNINIEAVSKEDYAIAIEIAKKHGISMNDGLAILFMDRNGLKEIYSFDKHFDKVEVISRVT